MKIVIEMPEALYERLEIQRKRWLEIMGKGFATAEEVILSAAETAVEQSEDDNGTDLTPEEQLIEFCNREEIAPLLKA